MARSIIFIKDFPKTLDSSKINTSRHGSAEQHCDNRIAVKHATIVQCWGSPKAEKHKSCLSKKVTQNSHSVTTRNFPPMGP